MNGPEKKVVYLAFCLFVVGVVVRVLPWGLPSIDSFQIEDVANKLIVPVGDSVPPAWNENPSEGFVSFEKSHKDSSKVEKKERKKKKKVQLPLHINTASVDDLCALNGVGPKLAEKIVAQREAKGPFKNPTDLKKVPGIGNKKLEAILPGVIFD